MAEMITSACEACAAPVTVLASQARRGRGRFCSRACSMPVARAKRHALAKSTLYDFWDRVDKTAGPDACWPWIGHRIAAGYGRVRLNGKATGAHRRALELSTGPAPDGKPYACHSCDNPPCCNPAHLRWGTHQENVDDKISRGRARSHPRKIDLEVAGGMRSEGASYEEIARVFGVNQASVGKALKRLLALQQKGAE